MIIYLNIRKHYPNGGVGRTYSSEKVKAAFDIVAKWHIWSIFSKAPIKSEFLKEKWLVFH